MFLFPRGGESKEHGAEAGCLIGAGWQYSQADKSWHGGEGGRDGALQGVAAQVPARWQGEAWRGRVGLLHCGRRGYSDICTWC